MPFDEIPPEKHLDYKVIGEPLRNLINTLENRIDREFPRTDIFFGRELFLLHIRIAKNTYKTILHLCREDLPPDESEFALQSIPLLRILLEQVFWILFSSDDLESKLLWYRRAGWRESKEEYDRLKSRHSQDPDWRTWFERSEKRLHFEFSNGLISKNEFSDEDARKRIKRWPIPSRMAENKNLPDDVRGFMQVLLDQLYRQFSQAAHLSFRGLAYMGAPLLKSDKEAAKKMLQKTRSDCAMHGITLVLALRSEMDNVLRVLDRQKIIYLWTVIGEYWGYARELNDARYRTLLNP